MLPHGLKFYLLKEKDSRFIAPHLRAAPRAFTPVLPTDRLTWLSLTLKWYIKRIFPPTIKALGFPPLIWYKKEKYKKRVYI